MADEYYAILGIEKSADEVAIKRAFRAIAKECHPDVAGADPDKANRFKMAREAYETLVDPALRARYDRPPRRRVEREGGRHGSFFDAMWKRTASETDHPLGSGGDGVQGRPPIPGAHDGGGQPRDSRAGGRADGGNTVDLDDLFSGGFGTRERAAGRPKKSRRTVDIGEDPSATASWRPGGGVAPPSTSGMASDDPNAPRRGDDLAMEVEIPLAIAARGGTFTTSYFRLARNPRWVPNGNQLEVAEIEDVLDLRVIRGTRDGEVLQERGKGNAGTNYGPYGDLYVTVRVGAEDGAPSEEPAAEPVEWGDEGHPRLDVGVGDAILGGRVLLETPTGPVTLVIPPGTSSGTVMRLAGKDEGGADLLVELRIVVPRVIDEDSRRLIEEFARRNPSI